MCIYLGGNVANHTNVTNKEARDLARSIGSTTYSGMDCKRKHGGLRYVSQGACVACTKQASIKFNESNPDYHSNTQLTPQQKRKRSDYHTRYVANNKEAVAAYQKEYHKTYKHK